MYNEKTLAKIAKNKSLLKEYKVNNNRTVYLSDGDEFQIQFFNPYNYVFCCQIKIDGDVLSNRLVIKPGERVWLERFMDKNNKFLFKTYHVNGNNQEVLEAISENGNVEVSFYKEKKHKDNFLQFCDLLNYNKQPKVEINSNVLKNANTINTSVTDLNNYYKYDYCGSTTDCYRSTTKSIATLDSYGTFTSTVDTDCKVNYNVDDNSHGRSFGNLNKKVIDKSIETGRVESGSYSNQKFEYCNYEFEWAPFKTETIKILPQSQKYVSNNDLQKKYCVNCGRKLKQEFTYCPHCGTKQ